MAAEDHRMSREEMKSAWGPIVALTAFVVLLLGAYVGGYLWLGTLQRYVVLGEWPGQGLLPSNMHNVREFPHPLLATIYVPAGIVESLVRGETIHVGVESEP
jgi:hypothetical protein